MVPVKIPTSKISRSSPNETWGWWIGTGSEVRRGWYNWELIMFHFRLTKQHWYDMPIFGKYHHEMWTCLHHVHPFGTVLVGLSPCVKLFGRSLISMLWAVKQNNKQLRKAKGPRLSVQHRTTYYWKHEVLLLLCVWNKHLAPDCVFF